MDVLEYKKFFTSSDTLDETCRRLADGNFTDYYNESKYYNIWKEEMCDNGTYFCPLAFGCIATNLSCDPDQVSVMDDSFKVFEEECAVNNQSFCPLYMHCIPMDEDCSYRKIFDWYKSGNMSVGPHSQNCAVNQTFCTLTFSCMESCDHQDKMGNNSNEYVDCGTNDTECKGILGPADFTNVTDATGSGKWR